MRHGAAGLRMYPGPKAATGAKKEESQLLFLSPASILQPFRSPPILFSRSYDCHDGGGIRGA